MSGANKHAKSVHPTRNNIAGKKQKSLMLARLSFDENKAAKEAAAIGATMAALDRYLATPTGIPARAALDEWMAESRKARAVV